VSDAALLQANEALILEMEAQCGEPIIRQAAWDRAGACIPVQEQCSHGVAVLATTQAARSAGLHILVDGIHDADADVNARFLILGRIGCAMISPCPLAASRVRAERKTTLLASVHNEPECLSSIFRVFADAGVAVLAIQTRLVDKSVRALARVLPTLIPLSHRAYLQFSSAPDYREFRVDRVAPKHAAGAARGKDCIAARVRDVL